MIYLAEVGAFDETFFKFYQKTVCDAHVAAYNLFCKDFDMASYHDKELAKQEEARAYW